MSKQAIAGNSLYEAELDISDWMIDIFGRFNEAFD